MMSVLIDTLESWRDSLEGEEASLMELTIANIKKLEKFKANAEPRLAKLNALEAYGVDNWQGYDEAIRSLSGEDEDDEQ